MEWRICKKHYLKYHIDRNYGKCPVCKLKKELEESRDVIRRATITTKQIEDILGIHTSFIKK